MSKYWTQLYVMLVEYKKTSVLMAFGIRESWVVGKIFFLLKFTFWTQLTFFRILRFSYHVFILLGKPSKKKVKHFLHWGGQDRSLLHFFFLQKHGLKWLNIAFQKPYFFCVKNVTFFFLMKASLSPILK